MADNVAVTPGSGATFATDDIGGIQYPRVKIAQGADGAATDVSAAAPLSVKLTDGTNPVTVTQNAPTTNDYGAVVAIHPDSVNANGQATMANSAPVVPASNWEGSVTLRNFGAGEYETVAASQTDQILGATGAVGDYLAGLLITPTTTGAGSVSIKDGNGSSIAIFNTGTLSNLVPFYVPLGIVSVNATTPGWKVTTGANVTVIGIGNFT